MKDLSKPLFSLTVGEYKNLHKEIIEEQLALANSSTSELEQDIIYIDDACKLTGYTKTTMYSKVSRFEIPVLGRGKPLTFSRKALQQWIKEGKPCDENDSTKDLKR